MDIFWKIAARSVSNLFSLYFVYLLYLFISRFGFKSGFCLLIAPVPVHCFSITFFFLTFTKDSASAVSHLNNSLIQKLRQMKEENHLKACHFQLHLFKSLPEKD